MRLLTALTLLALVAAPLAPAAAIAAADCRVGEITRVSGLVKLVRDGGTRVPVAGEAFCVKDRFETDARGVADLKFGDGTEITVGKETVFVISQWKQRRFRANEARFELLTGAFRALTGAITQRRHTFEVKTSIATIGVRGTEFWGGLDMSPGALDVIMLKGKGVYVANEGGTVEITRPGTGVTVANTLKKASTPAEWSPEKVKKAVSTITP